MRRRNNPIGIICILLGVIAGIVLGLFVRNTFFADNRFSMLIFWGILIGCGALGAAIGSKFRGKR